MEVPTVRLMLALILGIVFALLASFFPATSAQTATPQTATTRVQTYPTGTTAQRTATTRVQTYPTATTAQRTATTRVRTYPTATTTASCSP